MRQSGVYYLQIRGTTYWFLKVFCEQDVADGGWTVSKSYFILTFKHLGFFASYVLRRNFFHSFHNSCARSAFKKEYTHTLDEWHLARFKAIYKNALRSHIVFASIFKVQTVEHIPQIEYYTESYWQPNSGASLR